MALIEELEDTYQSCHRNPVKTIRYMRGDYKPNYPMPAATLYDLAVAIYKQMSK